MSHKEWTKKMSLSGNSCNEKHWFWFVLCRCANVFTSKQKKILFSFSSFNAFHEILSISVVESLLIHFRWKSFPWLFENNRLSLCVRCDDYIRMSWNAGLRPLHSNSALNERIIEVTISLTSKQNFFVFPNNRNEREKN